MADVVQIQRKIYGNGTFKNVVDVNFTQLVPAEPSNISQAPPSVEKFFSDYDSLFYDIPPSGSLNSHLELINRSSDYVGISIEEMQREIQILREENVALKQQIFALTNPRR